MSFFVSRYSSRVLRFASAPWRRQAARRAGGTISDIYCEYRSGKGILFGTIYTVNSKRNGISNNTFGVINDIPPQYRGSQGTRIGVIRSVYLCFSSSNTPTEPHQIHSEQRSHDEHEHPCHGKDEVHRTQELCRTQMAVAGRAFTVAFGAHGAHFKRHARHTRGWEDTVGRDDTTNSVNAA